MSKINDIEKRALRVAKKFRLEPDWHPYIYERIGNVILITGCSMYKIMAGKNAGTYKPKPHAIRTQIFIPFSR